MSNSQRQSQLDYLYFASAVVLVPLILLGNPALALLVAAALSLSCNRPCLPNAAKFGKLALQSAIILLGLGMNAWNLLDLSKDYALIISSFVLGTLGLGLLLGRLMQSPATGSKLITSGTAICGGTAIATLSPILRASPGQTGVALALIFLLNAAALFTLPWIGQTMQLTQTQFGLWVAMAVHDTSSVVATAAIYGKEAAEAATTLKLGRTLWLIPLALLFSVMQKKEGSGPQIPVFILLFIAASILGTWLDLPANAANLAAGSSRILLVFALFCTGAAISRENLQQLRGREVAQGLLLWLLLLPLTLMAAVWWG